MHEPALVHAQPTLLSVRRRWLAGLTLSVLLLTAAGRAQAPVVPALFGAAPAGASVPFDLAARLDTLDSRPVSVNVAALAASGLDIELTSGRVVRAELDRRDTARNGAQTWAGHIPGEPLSSVTLVWHDGVLQGSVRMQDSAYSIEPSAGTLHVVRLVDAAATGVELEPLLPPDDQPAHDAGIPPIAGDDASTIDVLAVYTAQARTVAGSDNAIQTRIALGVSETNAAYANSGITPRLRLLSAELTTYTESGNLSTDLTAVRGTADGAMDAVHARRDALGADVVVLVVGSTAGGACGVGYVMTSLSAGFAANAFTVTAYPCISPNYTFAHELGHNMGSAHAPEDPDGLSQPRLYPYSFGYKEPTELFRTVMAYDCAGGCPRILYFSNPNVNYSATPTGTVAQHNNALSINNAALTVANWRQAVGSGTAPTISTLSNVTIAEDAATSTINFTVGDAETAAASLTVTATSSNPTLVPNTGAALALGGAGASRTLVVTPAANRFGTAAITVTVNDGSRTTSSAFTLTVTGVNDAPTATRSPAAATIASGLTAHTTVTITDIDTAGSALSLTASSDNTTLLPNGNVAVSITGSTATTRTFDVAMTPAPGRSGLAVVTLNGSDGALPVVTTYTLTVTVPQPPTIGTVSAQSTPEDTASTVAFTVGDGDTPLDGLVVSAVSSSPSIVATSGMTLGGAGASRSLTLTPVANASGTTTITITVNDGLASAQTSFQLTVTAVDDAPVFAAGVPSAISTVVNTPTSFPVTLTDIDTPGSSLSLAATTTAAGLVSNGGLVVVPLSSTTTSRTFTVTVTPNTGATGAGGLGLLGEDLTRSVGRAVTLTVTATPAAPDAPTTLTAAVTGTTLTLAWTPASTGSTPVSYTVHLGNAAGATTLPVQTTTATSLAIPITVGGTYFARVRAVNTYGTSAASPEVSVAIATPNPRPGAPTGLVASFAGRTITLTWTAPTSGDPVTTYLLEAGTGPGLANILVVPIGAGTSFVAPGVPDGTFWLRVRGTNGAGAGTPSESLGVVMGPGGGCVGLPLAPVFQAPAVAAGVLTMNWTAPVGVFAPVSYVLHAGSGPGRSDIAVFDLGSTATTFSAAAPPGTYFLRVAGRGTCGMGAPSNEMVASVSGGGGGGGGVVPVAPDNVTGSRSGNVITVSWTPPTSGAAPTSYVVDVGSMSGAMNLLSFNTGNLATSISGAVTPGTYYIRIRSRTGTLVSPPSSEVVVTVP